MASNDYLKPVERAWDGMAKALFAPFEFKSWIKLGFLAWLACLGEGPTFFNPSGFGDLSDLSSGKGPSGASPFPAWHPTSQEIVLIAVMACAALTLLIVFSLAVLWVKSRARFMFMDALVEGAASKGLVESWKRFGAHGNSFFGFQICWGLAVLALCALPLGGIGGILAWAFIKGAGFQELLHKPALLAGAIALAVVFIALAIAAAALQAIVFDFASLHMYKNGSSAWTAAGKAFKLLKSRSAAMFVYLLSLIGVSLATGAFLIALTLAMCLLCCSCLLLYIPFVWAVILLPVLSFRRLFTIEFGANAGEEFAIATLEAKLKEPPPQA